ncbi:MAG: hypothetical protein HYW57_07675 [Ignavibacteriales bacterium]|nr:hypothetical protein [Ignavibacteriales bacterium]
MSRRIIYKVEERSEYLITDEEWDEVRRLQHWYNSEFSWTTGKLAFRRYLLFPNVEEFSGLERSIWTIIEERKEKLKSQGLSETETVKQLERDHLVFVKWGGYFDDCLASGYTRVADNEWNAFLVCDFLLKVSTLLPHLVIEIRDEGRFVKTGRLWLRDGIALLRRRGGKMSESLTGVIKRKQFFSLVDPDKYEKHPSFRNSIPDFNLLAKEDRRAVLRNWNWLGYGNGGAEIDEPDGGVNLNLKLRGFDYL